MYVCIHRDLQKVHRKCILRGKKHDFFLNAPNFFLTAICPGTSWRILLFITAITKQWISHEIPQPMQLLWGTGFTFTLTDWPSDKQSSTDLTQLSRRPSSRMSDCHCALSFLKIFMIQIWMCTGYTQPKQPDF